MFELPLDAKVTCTDGQGGTSVAVTLDPESMKISHLVVEDHSGNQRIVPLHMAAKTSDDEIWLSCSENEFKELPLFLVMEFVERAEQQSGDWAEEEGEWEDGVDVSSFERTDEAFGMSVQVERIPEGEVSFHRSTELEATDGHIGQVEKFIIEPESGQITHLVLQKGHLWGKKDVLVPWRPLIISITILSI
jgi:sporulation protein YlmC with PRC-barrel domain